MCMVPLFKQVIVGAAKSGLDVAGSALLPGAWPILRGALEPVLDQLARRLGVEDVTSSSELADKAVSEFVKDKHLQEILRTNLQEALEPVIKGQEKVGEDVQRLMLVTMGNTKVLNDLVGGVNKIEEMLEVGVTLNEEGTRKLVDALTRNIENSRKTREAAQNEIGGINMYEIIERMVSRLQVRGVELIREGHLDRAIDELQEGLFIVTTLLNETPSDVSLRGQLGYIYKTFAQAYAEAGDNEEADKFYKNAAEIFQLVKDEIPADETTAIDIANVVNGLGNVYDGRGDFEKAIEYYRLATTLNPNYAYAWHDMFLSYAKLAKNKMIDIKEMRHILQKVKDNGQGLPGLDDTYIENLENVLHNFEQEY